MEQSEPRGANHAPNKVDVYSAGWHSSWWQLHQLLQWKLLSSVTRDDVAASLSHITHIGHVNRSEHPHIHVHIAQRVLCLARKSSGWWSQVYVGLELLSHPSRAECAPPRSAPRVVVDDVRRSRWVRSRSVGPRRVGAAGPAAERQSWRGVALVWGETQ